MHMFRRKVRVLFAYSWLILKSGHFCKIVGGTTYSTKTTPLRNPVLWLAGFSDGGSSSASLIGQTPLSDEMLPYFVQMLQKSCFETWGEAPKFEFSAPSVEMSARDGTILLLVFIYCLCMTVCIKFPTLDHIKPSVSDKAQGRAVSGLLTRLLGDRSEEFIVTVNRSLSNDSLDVCELRSTKNNKIIASGSSGVAVASGIYNYMKYFCNCHVSWSGDQLDLPRPLPKLTGVLRINTPHRFVF